MLQQPLNTFIDLIGDFPKPIGHDDTPGKELAELVADGLAQRGFSDLQVMDGDFGFYVICTQGNCQLEAMVTVDDCTDMQRWQIITNFRVPLLERVFRRPWPQIFEDFLFAIDNILHESDRVTSIRWYPYFETSDYLALQPHSEGPIRELSADKQLPLLIRMDRYLEWIFQRITSPIGIAVAFAIFISLGGTFSPTIAGVVALIFFVAVLLIGAVIPTIISCCVASEARKRRG